jgi:uncharacterized protein (DUF2249 family)
MIDDHDASPLKESLVTENTQEKQTQDLTAEAQRVQRKAINQSSCLRVFGAGVTLASQT